MSLLDLVVQTVMVTPSGAFSPGPLTTAAVVQGALRNTPGEALRSGLKVAAGHMAFELPYVLALGLISSMLAALEKPLAVVSFIFSLFFAYLTARSGVEAIKGLGDRTNAVRRTTPFLTGVLFTGANPYFLMWWATVGLPIVGQAFKLGLLGIAVMYSSHVWMDYLWLGLMASTGGASRLLRGKWYGYLLIALAALLALFGTNMLLRAFLGVFLI